MLEGAVFALIGLQLWGIVTAPDIGRAPTLLVSGAVLLTVIFIRPSWIFLINGIGRLLRRPGAIGSWRPLAAVSWAGMRGVVSLAAAQTLPLTTPYRPLLLTCTIAVILGTLVLQGLTLPTVIGCCTCRAIQTRTWPGSAPWLRSRRTGRSPRGSRRWSRTNACRPRRRRRCAPGLPAGTGAG